MRVSIDERLARLCGDFSVARIGEWLERKFPSYDTSRAEVISIADTFKALVRETPFLNCALFDCLDRQRALRQARRRVAVKLLHQAEVRVRTRAEIPRKIAS